MSDPPRGEVLGRGGDRARRARSGASWRFLLVGLLSGALVTLAVGRVVPRADEGEEGPLTEATSLSSPAPGPETPAATQAVIEDSRRSAIVRAAEHAGPAVVSISVIQLIYTRPLTGPFGDEFLDQFFRDFSPARRQAREVPSLGSGVLVREDGLVLTNEHVVRGARAIKVTLTDGREFDGSVVGSDPAYDLALVRIEGERLPVAALGNSDSLLIGEWVVAIGNPFGYLLNDTQPTVTVGVVSAIHRDVKPQRGQAGIYQDMIQTDAAINPGNSGGPLVNSRGEVVGINTFIISQSGGSLGIGFALPINAARRAMEEFLLYGRVRPLWIGVVVREQEETGRGERWARPREWVTVAEVEPGSPAEKAGLRPADVIVEVNGREVHSAADAQRAIFGSRVGDRVKIAVRRSESRRDLTLVVAEAPEGGP